MKIETQEIFAFYNNIKEIQNLFGINQYSALEHNLDELSKIDLKEVKRISQKYSCGVHWALNVFNGGINEKKIDDIQKIIGKTKLDFFVLKEIAESGLTEDEIHQSTEYIDNINELCYTRDSIKQIIQLHKIGITVDEVKKILDIKNSNGYFTLRDFLDCHNYLLKSKLEKPIKINKVKILKK
jgi:hypothetical protein